MLRELHIANLAVIEDITIELSPGLNCFTGQTGAGKSLVLGAFEMLLGLRQVKPADVIRPGADEARVSGLFEVHDQEVAGQIGGRIDQAIAPGEQVLITRKLFASGRSSFSVNGGPATAAMVRGLGELLVDVHGQHDHQFLLKPSNQLLILDRMAGAIDLRRRFSRVHGQVRSLQQRREELRASGTLRRQQLELYEFQADEIDQVQPTRGEFAELKARHQLLANLQRLRQDAGKAYAALHEMDGSIVERLQVVAHLLLDIAEVDESLSDCAEQVRSATLSLQEAAFELSRYADTLDLDPAEMSEVEERLNVLNRLISKYAAHDALADDDPLAPVLAYREQIAGEIEKLRGDDEDLAGIDQQIAVMQEELDRLANELRAKRQAAAKKLTPQVEAQFRDLGMADAKLRVAFDEVGEDEAGAAAGRDAVEMLVRTNPGQPARPLRKIASGGELSRIMLAIKSILAGSDRTSVLVFDEIDANIGGRLGTVIGQKLRHLANGGNAGKAGRHQVLCITHLPQIAAFGDCHLRIRKRVEGTGAKAVTRTSVDLITGKQRVDELAEMLAGTKATATTRKQARELMQAAE